MIRFLLVAVYNLAALLGAALLGVLRLPFSGRAPKYVAFEIRGDPPYLPPTGFRRPLFRRRRSPFEVGSLRELGKRLQLLGKLRGLEGVLIRIEGLEASGAKIDALREMLAAFRARGKRVVFYARTAQTHEYRLLCAGDAVYLAPGGHLSLTGLAAEALAVGQGLSKIGVQAEFVRRGEFKTAPELFTHDHISPAHRRTIERLLDQGYERLLTAIAEGRKLSVEEARTAVDQGPYTSARALAQRLCDGVADSTELEELLMPLAPGKKRGKKPRVGPYSAALASRAFLKPKLRPLRRSSCLGLVPVSGLINVGEGRRGPGSVTVAGSDSVVAALKAAGEDRRTKAVLLVIDSRGGSSLASELILRAVRRLAAEKPVVAYIDRVAASGGYYVAVGAPEIMAAPTALTGSIGVFSGKFSVGPLLDKLGVARELFTRGRRAGLLSALTPFSEEERACLEAEVEEVYQEFLSAVAAGRKMEVSQVHALAEGRVYSGREAKELGLVDRLGSFEQAVARAAELGGLGKEPRVAIFDFSRRVFGPGFSPPMGGGGAWALMWPWIRFRGI